MTPLTNTKTTARILYVVVCCIVVAATAIACVYHLWPRPVVQSPETIERVVAMLASPNAAPVVERAGPQKRSAITSVDLRYDRQIQTKVFECIDRIVEERERAFKSLIGHLNDDRYSLTWDYDGDGPRNANVATVCWYILRCQLEPYQDCISHGDRYSHFQAFSYVSNVISDSHRGADWWTQHCKMDLREMQLESVNWLLENHATITADDPSLDGQIDLKKLRSRLDELKNAKAPIVNDCGIIEMRKLQLS